MPRLHLFAVALIAVLALTVACGGDDGEGRGTVAEAQKKVERAIDDMFMASALPTGALAFCLDGTQSYADVLEDARDEILQMVEEFFREGIPRPIQVHARWITHSGRTRLPESVIVGNLRFPAIPSDPIEAYQDSGNTDEEKLKALVSAATESAGFEARPFQQRAWEHALTDLNAHAKRRHDSRRADRASAKAELVAVLNDFRAALLGAAPPNTQTSDITGCVQAAAEVIHANQGRRVIVVASDLEYHAEQNPPQLHEEVSGVRIAVVYFQCRLFDECALWRDSFVHNVTTAGGILAIEDVYPSDADVSTLLRRLLREGSEGTQ